ncbi:MFS transporter [uncultured Jatrophihabitans sp.]|uniref:MFS transporter n=1 Tax=uncultured Jatrophihabitans sp. TaxID=1610747 RepID=UPI0035C9A087
MISSRQRSVALLVAGCFFMENLDGTIVVTAAPRIAADLNVSAASVGLVITAYLITLAVLIPLSGWLAGRFGNRAVFFAAIAVFTLASVLCAASPNLNVLVGARVLQGIGGAMMVPVGRLTVLAGTPKVDLLKLMSYIVWPGLVAPVIAPLAGGLITTYANWRWIFLINVPLGAVALVAAVRLLPASPRGDVAPLDWKGVGLTCAGLGGLTYTAHLVSTSTSSWTAIVVLGVLSALVLAGTARYLLHAPSPVVDLRTLRIRSLRRSLSGLCPFWLTVGAVPFLLPLLFEDVFGWGAVKAGAVVLTVFVGNIGIKPATTFLLNRYGFRRNLICASAAVAASVAVAGLFTATTPILTVLAVTVLSGAARSLGLTSYNALSFSEVPEDQMRHANSLAATVQQLFAGLGVAAATVALRVGAPIGSAVFGSRAPATPYTIAFLLLALVALLATAQAFRLPRDIGDAARQPHRPPTTDRTLSRPAPSSLDASVQRRGNLPR